VPIQETYPVPRLLEDLTRDDAGVELIPVPDAMDCICHAAEFHSLASTEEDCIFAHQELLQCPDSSPPFSLEEILGGFPADEIVQYMRFGRGYSSWLPSALSWRGSVSLVQSLQKTHSDIAVLGLLSKPDGCLCRFPVDCAHQSDLNTPFRWVVLIDADAVHPPPRCTGGELVAVVVG